MSVRLLLYHWNVHDTGHNAMNQQKHYVDPGELEVVVVSITNICNMRCPQCAYTAHIPDRRIDMAICIVAQVYEQAADIGVKTVRFLGLSEPTLHPHFDSVLEIAGQYRGISTHILTNGSTLGQKRVVKALEKYPPSILEVSIDAYTPETYCVVRGGNKALFEKVVSATREYSVLLKAGRSIGLWCDHSPRLRVSFVTHPESQHESSCFLAEWQGIADEVRFRSPHNFSGMAKGLPSQGAYEYAPVTRCGFIMSRIYIDVNGYIHACTLDFADKLRIGDISNGTSLRDAFTSAKRRRLTAAHVSGLRLPMQCNTCSKCADLR
jgi:radical SAM protein with 4Fe4S-binding SPASM domain